jgi:hypothetical protein
MAKKKSISHKNMHYKYDLVNLNNFKIAYVGYTIWCVRLVMIRMGKTRLSQVGLG